MLFVRDALPACHRRILAGRDLVCQVHHRLSERSWLASASGTRRAPGDRSADIWIRHLRHRPWRGDFATSSAGSGLGAPCYRCVRCRRLHQPGGGCLAASQRDLASLPQGRRKHETRIPPVSQQRGGEDNTARVAETTTGEELFRVTHEDAVNAVAFSPDGRYLATGSGDRTARVVETTTGKELLRVTHELHEHAVTALAFNPDGRYLATGSAGYNDEHAIARVVETSTGKELIRITHEDSVRRPVRRRSTRLNEVALGPDGRYLATGSEDKTARVVETTTGKELIRVTYKNPVYALAFSPDGRYLAIGSINDNRVVETTTGEELIRVTHEDSVNAVAVTAVAFSPDGRYLAIGSGDNTAVVVETTTGEELFRVTHEGAVVALAFSPDGRYLATGSEDNTVRVVETTTGKEIIRLPHEDDVRAVAFSLDGGVLYTGTVKEKVATLLRHLLRAEDLIAATCARLTRNLTAEEWKQYLGDTPYRMTCLDLPGPDDAPQASALQPPPGAGKAPSAEPASTPTKAPGPAVTAPPAIQPQPEQPTAPAPVQ